MAPVDLEPVAGTGFLPPPRGCFLPPVGPLYSADDTGVLPENRGPAQRLDGWILRHRQSSQIEPSSGRFGERFFTEAQVR